MIQKFTILLIMLFIFSCNSSNKKEKELLEKENELLKRELTLQKKEKKALNIKKVENKNIKTLQRRANITESILRLKNLLNSSNSE